MEIVNCLVSDVKLLTAELQRTCAETEHGVSRSFNSSRFALSTKQWQHSNIHTLNNILNDHAKQFLRLLTKCSQISDVFGAWITIFMVEILGSSCAEVAELGHVAMDELCVNEADKTLC